LGCKTSFLTDGLKLYLIFNSGLEKELEDVMPEGASESILKLFEESNALLRGHFKLTSGRHSEWYLKN